MPSTDHKLTNKAEKKKAERISIERGRLQEAACNLIKEPASYGNKQSGQIAPELF